MNAVSAWPDFLRSQGAQWLGGALRTFGDPLGELTSARAGPVATDLGALSCLEVTGADAEVFLQGQLSNDVTVLADGEGQYAAYCSPKGRILCIFVVLRLAVGTYELWLPERLAESMRKRLTMFVLRSKVAIRDASADQIRLGFGGPGALRAIERALGSALPAAPLQRLVVDDVAIMELAGGRYVLAASQVRIEKFWIAASPHAKSVGRPVWDWLTIEAGVPVIGPATQDQFVPQMANLDALGAINFRKGCYSGQEIVARMQYLGRLKERLHLAHTSGEVPAEGERIFSPVFGDQACGTVVNSAPSPHSGSDLLAVLQLAAAENGDLRLGNSQGSPLVLRSLPYALPAVQTPRARIS